MEYQFVIPYKTFFGQTVRVVGNCRQLGSWDPHHAPNMEWVEGKK